MAQERAEASTAANSNHHSSEPASDELHLLFSPLPGVTALLASSFTHRETSSVMAEEFQPFPHFGTQAIHAGNEPEKWTSGAVVPPISLSTTFKQTAPGEYPGGYDYSRSGNPTREVLETALANLENGRYALTYASGLAAMMNIVSLLQAGDEIISMNDMYGGSNRFFRHVASRNGLKIHLVDMTDLNRIHALLNDKTRLLWVETPTNPTLRVVDIEAVCKAAKEFKEEIIVAVDNTFMSSYFQRPLDLGADISHHSLTKYMNGHSDVVMGAAVMSNEGLYKRLKFLQNAIGAVPSPFDCFLVNRGLKTLHLRMREHMKNGLTVAKYLEEHPALVERVIHPGLRSHPQYELCKKQCRGYSGMVTFFIKGGLEEAKVFLQTIKVFTLAESLGGYESLAEHPAIMTHASVPAEEREMLGISDNLIRLSVGLEDVDDLIADLDNALRTAVFKKPNQLQNGGLSFGLSTIVT
ncbi:hypothetical protein RvY_12435 [Ramazzottius varieornatus]|uniref:cystathionine gamma-lyase n=1 Tax=Ramazzottius varieornatus TaxID=947166 RepID=A0A1D1VT89_RAMVA|nr:hypothetical protein RvY_12435 [Ramazzottius varieornatus]